MKKPIQKIAGIIITLTLIGGMIYQRSMQNNNQNYRNANFFVFWLSGRLLIEGASPYNPDQWRAGHEHYGFTGAREEAFLYPLPLAVIMIPIGLFSVDEAYFGWQILSQILIALVVFGLLNKRKKNEHKLLFIPMMFFFLFFGPIYLTLQIGSIGPMTLLILFSAIFLLERNYSFAAGIMLALTMLKPPQGFSILILIGFWLLAKRNWKTFVGIVFGGVILWAIGFSIDPNWVSEFLRGGQAAFDRRLGVQSNVWSIAHVLCNQNINCSFSLGGVVSLLLLGSAGFYLWRNHARLTVWQVFNLIIPIAFVSTIYLWAYDQFPYLIPIVWIAGTLVERTKSYSYAFIFLLVLDLYSLFALAQQASTGKDLWSLGNTIIVLGMVLGLHYRQASPIAEKDIPLHA